MRSYFVNLGFLWWSQFIRYKKLKIHSTSQLWIFFFAYTLVGLCVFLEIIENCLPTVTLHFDGIF